jgi:hypothetical protein
LHHGSNTSSDELSISFLALKTINSIQVPSHKVTIRGLICHARLLQLMSYPTFWLAPYTHQFDGTEDKGTYHMFDKQIMLQEIKHDVKVSSTLWS